MSDRATQGVDADTPGLARRIDVSAVQAWHTREDVVALAEAARRYGFVSAHVLPNWVPILRDLLAGCATLTGAPVGFPSGGSTTTTKVAEATDLARAGVGEMDVLVNVGRLRSGDLHYVEQELRAVIGAAGGIPTKVILEVGFLDDEQVQRGTEIAARCGAAFVKTGTGWSGRPTTVHHVRLIAESVGDAAGIKASGGIRDLATLRALEAAGATRFGINTPAAINILREVAASHDAAGGPVG